MPNRLKNLLIIVLTALLIFLGGYNFVVTNLRYKYFMVRQDKKILAEKLKKNKEQIKQAVLDKKQIVKLNGIYQEENKKLITISLSLLLDQLTKATQSSGVVLQSVQPLAAKEQGLLALYPVQFAIVGTYNQIQEFTATLVDLFSYVFWQNIKLTKIKNDELNMQVTCIIYGKKEPH